MAKILLRNLQKRLITSSATTISTSLTSPPPLSAAVQSSAAESAISTIIEDRASKKRASFLNFFRDYGFEDSQIQKVIESRVSELNPRCLKPKLDYFQEIGFTGENLHKLIVSNPYILRRSLDARIKPNFQLLKRYIGSDEKVMRVVNRANQVLCIDLEHNFIPNIEFLINEGVAVNRVVHMLFTLPRVLMQSRERMAYAVKTVKDFGITSDEVDFIYCLRVVCQLTEANLKKKLEIFKSFGYSDEQVLSMFRKCPTCLALSEETIRRKMGFFLNTMKLKPETVMGTPLLLTRSVEMIRARYEVLEILKSRGLTRAVRVTSVAMDSEDTFLNRYVFKYKESVPGLLDFYEKSKNTES